MKTGETFTINPVSVSTTLHTDEGLKKLISRRHPKYDQMLPHWNFMEATYDGGREWFKDNIFRYIKEGNTEYQDRVSRAYRFNHTREVVDLINKYLFKQAVSRNHDDAPKCLQSFWKRSTKSGLTIKDLARQISKKTSQFGRIGIVVDSTRIDKTSGTDGVLSLADIKENGFTTYAYIVSPKQLLDYSYNEHGELNWVLIHEIGRNDVDPFSSDGSEINRYRLWTRTDWYLYEEQNKGTKSAKKNIIVEVDSGTHDLGEVPVILADNVISDEEYTSPALIDDIAYLDRAVANYLSNLDAIAQDQTFSQLVIPAQGITPGDESYNKLLEIGTKRLFVYDGEAGMAPAFISPDVKQADLLLSIVNKIINEIYHTVGLAGERTKQDNAVGIDNSSGVAKAYDFERVNALLAAKADSLEYVENKIARLVLKWHGEEYNEEEPLVSYPDNFDTRGLYDEFDIAARLMLVEAPDEVRREQMKAVIDKLFPQLAKNLKEQMLKELKDWPQDPIELANRLTDKDGSGRLINTSTIQRNTGDVKDTTEAKAKEPTSGAKATKNNRQGQVTKDTKSTK